MVRKEMSPVTSQLPTQSEAHVATPHRVRLLPIVMFVLIVGEPVIATLVIERGFSMLQNYARAQVAAWEIELAAR